MHSSATSSVDIVPPTEPNGHSQASRTMIIFALQPCRLIGDGASIVSDGNWGRKESTPVCYSPGNQSHRSSRNFPPIAIFLFRPGQLPPLFSTREFQVRGKLPRGRVLRRVVSAVYELINRKDPWNGTMRDGASLSAGTIFQIPRDSSRNPIRVARETGIFIIFFTIRKITFGRLL